MSWQGFPQGPTDMASTESHNPAGIMPPDFLVPSSSNLNHSIPVDLLRNSNPMNIPASDNGPMETSFSKDAPWISEDMFPSSGAFAMPLAFNANDLHRSSSQPANRRRGMDPGNWSTSQQSRDTLYAHEFLKAFRARLPSSTDGQAACDYCRKRKIKCDRKKPTCGHCEQSNRVCTSNDILRKRGPPSKYVSFTNGRRERAMMDNAGIVFRKRNARPPKNLNRFASGEKSSDEKPSPSLNLANNRFDLAMASLDSADTDVEAFKVDNWLTSQNVWNPMGSLPTSLPGTGVNGSVPATDSATPQSAMGMNQSGTMPAPALPSILSESNLWISNNPFANTSNSLMNMNESASTPSLNSMVSSSASGSLGGVTDQNFVQLGRPNGTTSFESTTQGTPDLSLLTKPMALGADVPTSNTGLMFSNSVHNSSAGHVESVKHVISDPNSLTKLAELSTRTMLEYSRTHNIKSSVTGNASRATSLLLTSPSSDRGSELDACCVRVLNAEGDLAYWPQHSYYSSLVDHYQQSIGSTEFPGGTQYKDQLGGSFELFPLRQHWQESHFESLKNQSQALLRKMPVLTLIRMALKDVSASQPFLQWNDLETYVSVFTLSSANMAWTPLQVRQRQSLLLLLCALASSLVPAVHVTTHVDSTALSALPWELGMKCFQLARGLLHPVMGQMQTDESSLEFIQCMILMAMFMLRCQDKQSVWSPLAHGNAVSLHLLANAAATNVDMTYSVVEREMLKRCIWMLFMLEIDTRVDKDGVQPLSLWSSFPFKLEQPVSLNGFHTAYGPADMGLTHETLERFKSQTELCQIMLSVLLLRLHEPMPRTEEVMEVVRALQHELTKWASHTPCLIHTDTSTTTTPLAQAWQPPSVIPFPALYEACTFYLAHVHE